MLKQWILSRDYYLKQQSYIIFKVYKDHFTGVKKSCGNIFNLTPILFYESMFFTFEWLVDLIDLHMSLEGLLKVSKLILVSSTDPEYGLHFLSRTVGVRFTKSELAIGEASLLKLNS